MDYDKLLNLAAELGYQLMSSGAEIYRVEESVLRLLQAYGLEDPQVFAIPNALIVSVSTPQGHPITRMRRIPSHGTDIELLEQCNSLCRRLCAHPLPLEEAQAQVEALSQNLPTYTPAQILLGYGAGPAFFTLLFGGGVQDGLCAFLCGLAVGLCLLFGRPLIGSNIFFRTAICSAVASLFSLLLVRAGLGLDMDTITIGVLMVLVPGVALTNAMREIMAGDIFSGVSRMAEAVLIASAIALGVMVGLSIGQIPDSGFAIPQPALGLVLPSLWAFLACIGFTIVFNIRGLGQIICSFGGAIGWLVYLLGGQSMFAAFLAAVSIGVFSEVMARVRRCPATSYLLVALLPLVPGGGIYYAMRYCVAGYRDLFLNRLLGTFGMAAALAVGAMLASSLFRALFPRFPRLPHLPHPWHGGR